MHPTASYRPEIDGLRALAVLCVLLFHLDPRLAPGGFIGVDIFFVLSGFLITSIIVGKQQEGQFSFTDFYLRRIRRIAPAYFLVIVATLVAGSIVMLPQDSMQLASSALWSSFSLPNVHTWLHLDTGYFAADSRQIPLLHLWSLGVEEQFYLIWPILLLLGIGWLAKKALVALLLMLMAASFALAQQQNLIDPALAYYMLPSRAGELAIGGLLAFIPGVRQPSRQTGRYAEVTAVLGLLMIGSSVLLLDENSRFPGFLALPSCLGTALVIIADSQKRCIALAPLRSSLMVGIGLISYSIYLWHWPVLALLRYQSIPFTATNMLVFSAIIFVLALLCYWLVERPTRHLTIARHWQLALLLILPLSIVTALALFIQRKADAAMQIQDQVQVKVQGQEQEQELAQQDTLLQERQDSGMSKASLLAQTAPAYEFSYNCQLSTFQADVLQRPACVHGNPEGAQPEVLLWGDSHAAHYIGVIATIAQANNFRVRNASLSTCPPVFGRDDYGVGIYQPHCAPFRKLISDHIDAYKTVILGANWKLQMRHAHFDKDFRSTVASLSEAGKQVILLAQAPDFPGYERQCELRQFPDTQGNCKAAATRRDAPGKHERQAYLQSMVETYPGVHLLDIHEVICQADQCSAYLDGKPVYFDSNHLSMEGSWQVGQRFLQSSPTLPAPLRRQ